MGKVKSTSDFQGAKDLPDIKRFVSAFCSEISREFNGRISFGDNISASGPHKIEFTSASEKEITHQLSRIPLGFLVIDKNSGVDIWRAATTWTETNIYLTSGGAVTVTVYVI